MIPFTILALILGFGQGMVAGLGLLGFLSIFYIVGGVIFRHWLRLAWNDTLLLVEPAVIAQVDQHLPPAFKRIGRWIEDRMR